MNKVIHVLVLLSVGLVLLRCQPLAVCDVDKDCVPHGYLLCVQGRCIGKGERSQETLPESLLTDERSNEVPDEAFTELRYDSFDAVEDSEPKLHDEGRDLDRSVERKEPNEPSPDVFSVDEYPDSDGGTENVLSPDVKDEPGCSLRVSFVPLKTFTKKGEKYPIALWSEGSTPCTIHSIRLKAGANSAFQLDGLPPTDYVLSNIAREKKNILQFSIAFLPKSGKLYQDKVIILSGDPKSPVKEILAEGQDASIRPCLLQILPSAFRFPMASVGTTSIDSISLYNKGNLDCVFSSFSVEGISPAKHQDFKIENSPTASYTIKAGESLTLKLSFSPTQKGEFLGRLIAPTNDFALPFVQIPLKAVEGYSCVTVFPKALHLFPGSSSFLGRPFLNLFPTYAPGCPGISDISFPFGASQMQSGSDSGFSPVGPGGLMGSNGLNVLIDFVPTSLEKARGIFSIQPSVKGVSNHSPLLVPVSGQGTGSGYKPQKIYKIWQEPVVDIIFLLSASTAMAGVHAKLSQNIGVFLAELKKHKVRARIGIASTNLFDPKHGCLIGNPPMVSSTDANALQMLGARLKIGTSAQAYNYGSEILRLLFLKDFCASRHFRTEAFLHVIFITEKTDPNSARIEDIASQYLLFRARRWLRVSSVVGPFGGCMLSGGGKIAEAKKYLELAKIYGGEQLSICTTDWQIQFKKLAQASVIFPREFVIPVNSNVSSPKTVSINQTQLPQDKAKGWYLTNYSHGLNSSGASCRLRTMRFAPSVAVQGGDSVFVEFW